MHLGHITHGDGIWASLSSSTQAAGPFVGGQLGRGQPTHLEEGKRCWGWGLGSIFLFLQGILYIAGYIRLCNLAPVGRETWV